jgi:segregation and condensation protein B
MSEKKSDPKKPEPEEANAPTAAEETARAEQAKAEADDEALEAEEIDDEDDLEDDEDDEEDDDDDADDDGDDEEDEEEEDEDDGEDDDDDDEDVVEVVEAEIVEVTEVLVEPAVAAVAMTEVVSPDHAQHLRLLEALIFAGDKALDEKDLVDRLPNDADLPRLLIDLSELYAGRGVNLVKVAGGWAFRTAPDLSEKLKIEKPVTRKLSRASVETLAIIAYHQPVTRAEIEQVRGVGLSKGTLDLLFEQNWIKPMGRRRAPGKPVTWGTTDFFLEHFGLGSLDDLPGQEELKAAGLLDARSQPPIFRPEEPDLPLEPTEDEDEPLAAEDTAPGSTAKAE